MHVARRQFAAQVLSRSRQEWINTLRNELAHVVAAIHELNMVLTEPTRDAERIAELVRRANLHDSMVTLLLNPAETDHQELRDLITHALNAAVGGEHDVTDLTNRAVTRAQQVLKREWERVKKGE